ncbi:MAG: MBL fold metallo-hydrolase [Patescibacteria group bacterium]
MPRAAPKRSTLHATRSTILLIVAGFVLSIVLWASAAEFIFPWQEQPLRVWMLDIGQGDAFFIEFPTGEQMLVDGGPDDSVLAKLGSLLPPWDRTLDAVLLTHPDADHVTGLVGVLDRYDVGTIYETGVGAHTPQADAFVDRQETIRSDRTLLNMGDVIRMGDVTLTILWPDGSQEGTYPEKRNNFSINFVLEYGETRVLFTGDAEAIVEESVGSRVGDIDVLKVGHHGSLTSTSWKFLETITPEVALISMGRENTYGHPHPVVIERLEDLGATIFRTDLDRDVLLTSYDGEPHVLPAPLPF